MKVRQISVFLENRSGRLADTLRTLAEAKVNIRALSIADTNDFGILRLIVDDTDAAVAALRAAGRTVATTHVLAVEIPDEPGGLSSFLARVAESGHNIEYLYAFVTRRTDRAVVIFRFENVDAALEGLLARGVRVLCPADLENI